jgi:seryl-tRNA synthetase
MFSFCAREVAESMIMRSIEEEVLQDLAFLRAVNIAAGDLGSAAKKYDLEAWLPTCSVSQVTSSKPPDYQARRKVRAKGTRRRVSAAHPQRHRCRKENDIAIMENYQTEEGLVGVPPSRPSRLPE